MRHKDKLYVFSSKEAALKFATSPDYFIAEVLEKAKLSPELIQLLKLHQQFSCVSPYSEVKKLHFINATICMSSQLVHCSSLKNNNCGVVFFADAARREFTGKAHDQV